MTDDEQASVGPVLPAGRLGSYIELLQTNHRFRRFWFASAVSQLGDWFNYIGLFVLITDMGGSSGAVSWFLVAKFLPTTLLGPLAGVVADRFSRRWIMIVCDLLRAVVVLCYLLVAIVQEVWLIYLLAFVQESVWTFNHPARQASIPDLCSREELNTANGLFGISWSMNLALGAAVGGVVSAWYGWKTAIMIDAGSFVVSALLIAFVNLPVRARKEIPLSLGRLTGLPEIRDGLTYVRTHPKVAALLMVKSGWALSGGILVMLTVFGEQVFAEGGRGGLSGLLYSMRGIGAAVGPLLAWRLFGNEPAAMRRAIGLSFFLASAAYLLFSLSPNIIVAGFCVLAGHVGGSTQWVFSSALLHHRVAEQFRGRVFAAEMALLTLVLSISSIVTGQALDAGISPRIIVAALAALFLVPGAVWQVYLRHLRQSKSRERSTIEARDETPNP